MTSQHAQAQDESSSIYDLGYRRYEGARLGRRHAILALFRESLRAAFGLGRGWSAKVGPVVLIFIALVPALLQLVIGALVPIGDIELIRHDDYYGGVKFILALYVGVVAPDVVGRDQRTRSLTLYFTRAISRFDYALGKLAAMTAAMLMITLVPQLLLFFGNALAVDDIGGYASENWDLLFPIVGTALFGSWLMASIGTVIAAQTPQRAFATVGIIVAFLLPTAVAAVLVQEMETRWTDASAFLSPLDVFDGLTYWMFRTDISNLDGIVTLSGYAPHWFALAGVVLGLGATALLLRRYAKVQA
ncbi:MAG: ABC transporter permease [Dehalococcoidia bacterium]